MSTNYSTIYSQNDYIYDQGWGSYATTLKYAIVSPSNVPAHFLSGDSETDLAALIENSAPFNILSGDLNDFSQDKIDAIPDEGLDTLRVKGIAPADMRLSVDQYGALTLNSKLSETDKITIYAGVEIGGSTTVLRTPIGTSS